MDQQNAFAQAMTDMLKMYEERREQLSDAQERLTNTSASVTSDRRVVTVTVGAQGQLLKVTFNTREYEQLGPRELARLIVETAAKAHEAARNKVSGHLTKSFGESSPFPAEFSLSNILSGQFEVDKVLPANPVDLTALQRLRDWDPFRSGSTSPATPERTRGSDDE